MVTTDEGRVMRDFGTFVTCAGRYDARLPGMLLKNRDHMQIGVESGRQRAMWIPLQTAVDPSEWISRAWIPDTPTHSSRTRPSARVSALSFLGGPTVRCRSCTINLHEGLRTRGTPGAR